MKVKGDPAVRVSGDALLRKGILTFAVEKSQQDGSAWIRT